VFFVFVFPILSSAKAAIYTFFVLSVFASLSNKHNKKPMTISCAAAAAITCTLAANKTLGTHWPQSSRKQCE
jgi:hypothetical protein